MIHFIELNSFHEGCKLVPHFNTYSLTNTREIRIVSHSDSGSTTSMHATQSVPRSHPWDPSVTIRSVADTGSHIESEYNLPNINLCVCSYTEDRLKLMFPFNLS